MMLLMLKLLIMGFLAWILVSMLRKKLQSPKSRDTQRKQSDQPAEQVVPCQHCGLHVPQSSAISHQQHFFCSQQHLDAHEMAQ